MEGDIRTRGKKERLIAILRGRAHVPHASQPRLRLRRGVPWPVTVHLYTDINKDPHRLSCL